MRITLALVAALTFFTLHLSSRATAAPVAMTCHLQGTPQVRSAGAWGPLRLLQRLSPGDVVRCGAGAQAVLVLFANSQRYRIDAGKQATVSATTVTGAQKLGGLGGASGRIAQNLGNTRVGAYLARPAQSHQRLTPDFPGYMEEGNRNFTWPAIAGAATYSFTLFDQHDNVVWSSRGADTTVEYPADLPYPGLRRPYVWRLTPYGQSGKPQAASRWGVVTFLAADDAAALRRDATQLEEEARAKPTDVTPLALLAELYRSYGVLERTLEILEDQRLAGQPGRMDTIKEVYGQISKYGRALAASDSP